MSCANITSVLGCGGGILATLAPSTRTLCGGLLLTACLMAPLGSAPIAAAAACIAAAWCLLAAMPPRMWIRSAAACVILFGPYLLLTPWMNIDPSAADPARERLCAAAVLVLRGACCLYVSAATLASVAPCELYEGFSGLPLPQAMTILLAQITHQALLLIEETARTLHVLRLRGATGAASRRVVFAFPVTWLGRLLFRAERTAAAMTVRGYGTAQAPPRDRPRRGAADRLAVLLAALCLCVSLFLLLRGCR